MSLLILQMTSTDERLLVSFFFVTVGSDRKSWSHHHLLLSRFLPRIHYDYCIFEFSFELCSHKSILIETKKIYKMSSSSVCATRRASLPVCIREALLMFTQSRKKKYFFLAGINVNRGRK